MPLAVDVCMHMDERTRQMEKEGQRKREAERYMQRGISREREMCEQQEAETETHSDKEIKLEEGRVRDRHRDRVDLVDCCGDGQMSMGQVE